MATAKKAAKRTSVKQSSKKTAAKKVVVKKVQKSNLQEAASKKLATKKVAAGRLGAKNSAVERSVTRNNASKKSKQRVDAKNIVIECVSCCQLLQVPTDLGSIAVTCPACNKTWIWDGLENPSLASEKESADTIPLGAHLISPRSVYSHHGIYVGQKRVIHYAGWCDGPRAGKVEEVDLRTFCGGRDFYVKGHSKQKFKAPAVIQRARSRVGENLYSVWANNCEHFCEWAINGDHHSGQVDRVTGGGGVTIASGVGLAARGVVAASGSVVGLSGAGIMSGLASTGALIGGGAVAGLGVLGAAPGLAGASLLNSTVLADNPGLDEEERQSRTVGRAASYAGAVAGTAGSIGAVSALGTAGLSAAGISSGLAAIGATVGGGMASGVVIATAAPVAAAAAVGYGVYKLVKWFRT